MKQAPQVISVEQIQNCDIKVEIDGKWVPSRPLSIGGFFTRLKLAFQVFTGKYDALKWHQQ